MEKKFESFVVIVPTEEGKTVYTMYIIGYDRTRIDNIYTTLCKLIDTSIKRGDGKYEDGRIIVDMLIADAWRSGIHLEAEYPSYGTFDYTEDNEEQ